MSNTTYVSRPSVNETVKLTIHHRGESIYHLVKLYVGTIVSEMKWDLDVDLMSFMDLESMITSEGYGHIKCLWYWIHALSFTRGLRPLNNDQDILTFNEDVKGYNVIDVYVENPIEIPVL
ncbi:unnamed protein product [Vicia faba]|uniref:PB1-like domain-containing protein n=1 Tax=Vicia faba TaxID=3906 RepID=A0AAV0YJD1_VICFA|nr:unnamed protein product [Vicia faba]